MTKKTLKSAGEFGLISEIRKIVLKGAGTRVGIGDDAAVLKIAAGKETLFTTDMLIEGVHFRLSEATAHEIGWKAMAVNVSDIAAMGGLPTHAVVSLGLPTGLGVEFVREMYRGMSALAERFGVGIVGGDTNRSDKLTVSIALLGAVEKNKVTLRSGAQVGDVIFVTGSLGGSYASRKHLRFLPRVPEARFLTQHFRIHSMMDVSDGVASDIRRIAEAGGVGAILCAEAIPVSESARSVKAALTDGEDFELLFTLSPHEAARLSVDADPQKYAPFRPIGKIVDKRHGVKIVYADGRRHALVAKGYDHFKASS